MKYQIWDKKSRVITPSGEVFTAAQWKDMYPLAKIDGIDLVLAQGTINGALCNEYDSMREAYDRQMKLSGIEKYKNGIPEDLDRQDALDLISEFEDDMSKEVKVTVTPEERIAAALEAQVMLAMPDEEV